MSFNSLDILKLRKDQPYSDTFVDRFHLASDYKATFADYEWVNTQGIADSHNSIDGWEMLNDSEIERLKGMGIEYPDYSFITSESDAKRNPYPLAPGQKRQPTHTVEHIVYAMPGDVIPLYPYYSLAHTPNFKENFSHWYNYKTGGLLEYTAPWSGEKTQLLDFLTDPSNIQKSERHGYLGGKYMSTSSTAIKVGSVDDYVAAVDRFTNVDRSLVIELTADLDFAEYNAAHDGNTNSLAMGLDWRRHFGGQINGNGHTISNYIIEMPETDRVGLVGYTSSNAMIANLHLDSSCRIHGKGDLGLVGFHASGKITLLNISSEMTVIAENYRAGGLIGNCNDGVTAEIKNCHIGGSIGKNGLSNNAALIANWQNNQAELENVLVTATLAGFDSNPNRKYIISNHGSSDVTTGAGGVKTRGGLKFTNCHGALQPEDECWDYFAQFEYELPASDLAKLGWTDMETPPMPTTVVKPTGYTYGSVITIGSEEEYIQKINAFNATKDKNSRPIFELTRDLDFSNYGPDEVPMLGWPNESDDCEFNGIFNGAGHKISNLTIIRDQENVGFIAATRQGASIQNLIIDSSCLFQGTKHVGLVGRHRWDPIVIRNVKTEATYRGTVGGEKAAAAIIGFVSSSYSTNLLTLENIYIGGVIGNETDPSGSNNGVISGWVQLYSSHGVNSLTNIVVNCKLYGNENANRKKYFRFGYPDAPTTLEADGTWVRKCTDDLEFHYKNCYGNIDPTDEPWQAIPLEEHPEVIPQIAGWADKTTPPVLSADSDIFYLQFLRNGNGNRRSGTVATFFCPRNPFDESETQSLPLPDGEDEYIFAADFSQTFSIDRNVDQENKKLYEPIVAFRHIFRIRDGKKFADEISGSVESNSNYLRKTRKFVTARAGEEFTIRLENPMPRKYAGRKRAPSHYYYIDNEGKYQEVDHAKVNVLDGNTRKRITNVTFTLANRYPGYGSREIDGVKYTIGESYYLTEDKHPDYEGSNSYNLDNENEYYLMLRCLNPPVGHYVVQLKACDYHDKDIHIKGTSEPLVIMEYDITILPETGAWMIDMPTLYTDAKYKDNTPERLDVKYGSPTVKIDFDEYMNINRLDENDPLKWKLLSRSTYSQGNSYQSYPGPDAVKTSNGMDKSWFKWPVPWGQSTYIFGYNDRFDYSMYQLATHSENVIWKYKAQDFPEDPDPASLNGNKPGDGTGLFDRRYYASKLNATSRAAEDEQGYFYYVNAASDPGVTATLKINELCPGSRVVVSAWMSEFSEASERGNLSFNFVAVLKDNVETLAPTSGFTNGQRVKLHQFISGAIPKDPAEQDKRGKWMNIYYSFLPRLSEFSTEGVTSDMIDHYELDLDNNAQTSNGADYAIDDIRAYVVPPETEIKQLVPICADSKMRLKMTTPFYSLLELARTPETVGDESETGKELQVFYAVLDKEEFDKLYYDQEKTYQEAFEGSVIDFSTEEDKVIKFDEVTFRSNYIANPVYVFNCDNEVLKTGFREDLTNGDRNIVFESSLREGIVKAGKTYYFILKSPVDDKDMPDGVESTYFDMFDKCANTSAVTIKPSQLVKVRGSIVADLGDFSVCANQRPMIQVDILGSQGEPGKEGETTTAEHNASLDWFNGTINEYEAYNDGNPEHTLVAARSMLRVLYPTASSMDDVTLTPPVSGEEHMEQWMIDLLTDATTETAERPYKMLYLNEPSYVMPAIKIDEGKTEGTGHVVAIPIKFEYGNLLICTDPQQIDIKASGRSPILQHGLTGITYPEDIEDVPLRIGLDQIRTEKSLDNIDMKIIDIPVRKTMRTDDGRRISLVRVKEDVYQLSDTTQNLADIYPVEKEGPLMLVKSNDPQYRKLCNYDVNKEDIEGLMWVGDVKLINAATNAADGAKQYFQVQFDQSLQFKEGYEYSFLFHFAEDGTLDEDGTCYGEDVFTLKIVPKYVAWTGSKNLNWDNDANWRRVGSSDLLLADDMRTNELAHYNTEGKRSDITVNPNPKAYAPLDFTHAIVSKGTESPYLYAPTSTTTLTDEYDSSMSFSWPDNPSQNTVDATEADEVGEVSDLIHYDMAARDLENGNGRGNAHTGCRPWTDNTCREIHFNPGGTLMNQQELNYKRAWVDLEVDPSRWYLLSLPLQEAYAGDFYLPTSGARQQTELFQDITFSTDLNDRFRPAVYQRGWDKSSAKVYELQHPDASASRNVAIKTFWSHVYNDVTEKYGSGAGYSVKVDISSLSASDWTTGNRVKFRFPKADTAYDYYTSDGLQNGHHTDMSRGEGQYRLNDVNGSLKATTATDGSYFLVGNPFMTHLDIAKFLETNSDKLEPKYWLVTEKGQIAVSASEEGVYVAEPSQESEEGVEDPTTVAPMQGFFVKAKTEGREQTLSYNASMMRRYDSEKESYLKGEARSTTAKPALKITAYSNGEGQTAALVIPGESNEKIDVAAIDNRDLDIAGTVYTVKDNKALTIATLTELEGVEVGLISDDDTETVLRFEGLDAAGDGLCLYDKTNGQLTRLTDGTEYRVYGPSSGQLFLTYGLPDEDITGGLEWQIGGGTLTVTDNACSGMLNVKIVDMLGRNVAEAGAGEGVNRVEIALTQGIYIAEIVSAKERKCVKIRL